MSHKKIQHDSEAPAHGQQVITCCAFIYRITDGGIELFMPKRADTKKFLPGVYELPGGHIDFGENLITGLKREIKEEFQVDIEVGDTFAAFDYLNSIKGSHSVEIIYFAKFTDENLKLILHPDDHSGYKWIKEDEIDTILISNKLQTDDPEIIAIRTGFKMLKKLI